MDICHAFLKKNLLYGKYINTTYRLLCTIIADPEYQGAVPILDGGEGASEHLVYGTNINWKTEEQGETPSQPTSLEPMTTQDDDQQPNGLTGESASEEHKELPKEEEPREEPKDEAKEKEAEEEAKEEPKEEEAKELPEEEAKLPDS